MSTKNLSRRRLLGLLAALTALPKRIGRAEARQEPRDAVSGTRVDRWHRTNDRVWLGERFWANPMEDWRVMDGAAEVQTSGGDRKVHLLTRRLTGEPGRFRMSVRCRRVEVGERDGGVGFRIGIRNRIDDHRSNCFARGVGVDAGLVDSGLVLGETSVEAAGGDAVEGIILVLQGRTEGQDCKLSLRARTASGRELGNLTHTVPAAEVEGNVAIVSNFDREIPNGEGARYRFSEWTVDGDAFEVDEGHRFGRGHTMKVLLSQTVFAGVATHHGGYDDYLIADLDCGGWPQTPRNRLVRIVREAKCLHVCGDQHLPSLVQYGADAQRDGCWAFCTPAISAGYPRWWRPDEVGTPHGNRPRHGLAQTGEFLDPLGNRVYVYAIGNPEVGTAPDPYERAHQKSSGFGLVTIDTEAKTYRIEAFRFLSAADDADSENAQFPGWPVTVHQDENAGENRIG